MLSEKTKSFLGLLIIGILFILSSYFVKENIDFVRSFIGNDFIGIIIYILITILAIVVAPIGILFLIPVASNIFGWFPTAIFNIVGWFLGSIIVFWISRKYGVPLIKKFISLEKINKLESKIPKENLFIDIILLRMIIPVDVLSYALGLFSKVDFKTYAWATIIGITPFAFVFSYLGTVSVYYQIFGFIFIILLVVLITKFYRKKKR